jgi:hypothetical protein
LGEECQAKLTRCKFLKDFLRGDEGYQLVQQKIPAHVYGDEVFERLAHFETFYMKVTGMEEIINPRIAIVICLN